MIILPTPARRRPVEGPHTPRRIGESLWSLQSGWDDEAAASWARATIARVRAETRAAQSRTGLAGPHDHWICAAAAFAVCLLMVSA